MEVYRRSSGLLLLLGFVLLATTLQGVQGEVESEGPSESECRPYIEKALKELEAGEGVVGSSEAADDSKEDIPTVEITDDSEHQDGDGDDNDSNEDGQESKESKESTQEKVSETKIEPEVRRQTMFQKITNRISQFFQRTPVNNTKEAAIEEKSTDKEADESQEQDQRSAEDDTKSDETETKDESKEDEKDDSVEATADADSKEGDDKEAASEAQESGEKDDDNGDDNDDGDEAQEQAKSEEATTAVSKEESGEAQEQTESEEAADKSKEESEEGPAESKEEEAVQEQAESVEETPEQDDSKEADDGDSKAGDDDGTDTDGDSKEVAEAEDDSKEDAKQESTEEPGQDEPADSKEAEESVEKPGEEQDDTQEDEGSSTEQPDHQDSKQHESVEDQEDSQEAADDDDDDDKKDDSVEDQPKAQSEEDKQESVEEKKDSGEDKDDTEEDKTDSKEGDDEGTDDKDEASKEDEKSGEDKSIEKREAGDEPDDDSKEKVDESEEERKLVHDDDDDDSEEITRSTEGDAGPVEELSGDIEIPAELRSREHVEHLLKLDEESSETETVIDRVNEITLKELKKLYENAIKPLETVYKYRDLSNRHFGDSEIFSKPLVLFMGPWSGGKSSIINYLVNIEYNETALRTGAEPSPAYFNILMYGDEPEVLDGTELAADFTFSGLQKFGQGLEERLRGLKVPSPLLEKVNIVEIPGILEVRKQVSRVFPFNDACQWFIDRADIIFLVYDPSKLDVGPETEAILDQLKGREHQTRIVLNKADQVKPEELMRVQGALIWNISPLMSSPQPPVMYTTSLWSRPFEPWAPTKLLQAQERAFLRDLRGAIEKRIENKIASARRFAVRVRNHAKMVDCYLTTYYNHKSVFGNRKQVADEIIDHPQDYHIYEGLSTLTNISRYDLPDPDVYRDFFKLNPLYEFQQLSATCTYFRGCPINRLDIAIAYDLPELVGTHKKLIENALTEAANQTPTTPGS